MIVFKQDLFELRKSQELRGTSFEYQMTAMRERIDSVMAEMKSRNNEFTDKFDRHLIAEEKNHNILAASLERINHRVEDVSESASGFRERQIFNKEQIENLNADLTEHTTTIKENKESLEKKLDENNKTIGLKVEKLEKAYYTATGAILIIVSILEVAMEYLPK